MKRNYVWPAFLLISLLCAASSAASLLAQQTAASAVSAAVAAVVVFAASGRSPFQHPGEEVSAASLLYRIVHEEPRRATVSAVTPTVVQSISKADFFALAQDETVRMAISAVLRERIAAYGDLGRRPASQ